MWVVTVIIEKMGYIYVRYTIDLKLVCSCNHTYFNEIQHVFTVLKWTEFLQLWKIYIFNLGVWVLQANVGKCFNVVYCHFISEKYLYCVCKFGDWNRILDIIGLYNITCLIGLSFLCSSVGECVIELVLLIWVGAAYSLVRAHLYGINYLKQNSAFCRKRPIYYD